MKRIDRVAAIYPSSSVLDAAFSGKPIRACLQQLADHRKHQTHFFEQDSDIFFARTVLLVEGPAEKYGFPVLGRLLNADTQDVTVISANGKGKIPPYVLLCRAFSIPCFVWFDHDGEPDGRPSRQVVEACSDKTPFYAFEHSFEHAFGIGANRNEKALAVLEAIDELTEPTIPGPVREAMKAFYNWLQTIDVELTFRPRPTK